MMTSRVPEPPSSQPGGTAPQQAPGQHAAGKHAPGKQEPSEHEQGPDLHLLAEIDRIMAGEHYSPHSILGPHLVQGESGEPSLTIRALRPLAKTVTAVLADGSRHPMPHLHQGVWEVTIPGKVLA